MTCLRLVSPKDRNLCFGFTGGVLLVHHWCLSGAQLCYYPSALVPFLRHFINLVNQEYLLVVQFSYFLLYKMFVVVLI